MKFQVKGLIHLMKAFWWDNMLMLTNFTFKEMTALFSYLFANDSRVFNDFDKHSIECVFSRSRSNYIDKSQDSAW